MPRPDVYLQPTKCPHCGVKMPLAGDALGAGSGPSPGDYSICIECGGLAEFTEKLELVAADESELDADGRANVAEVRAAIASTRSL